MTVVDDVKARTDIVDLIQSRVPLQKAGRNFKANCPFHNEKTPSFIVFPERGTWHCFGACGTGGDAFSFIQRADNLTFSEALSRLAERAGVTIADTRRQDETQRKQNDVLYTALQNTADYFHRILTFSPAGEQALRYLHERGVTDETIKDFQLGMAPKGWESLKGHLSDLGHTEEQMLAAGLIIERDGDSEGSYDRFRERLMFPIRDGKGRVIGFGARALDDSQPKYLNSPQTPLFDKSGALFAIDRAEQAIRAEGEVVLVEGYMDALQAHQAGFSNVVAIMGTALTERQVSLVRNMVRCYALALDPDTAGEEATRRSLEGAFDIFRREVIRVSNSAVPMGVRRELPKLRIITLPPDRDPDDVIRDDPDDWRKRVEEATPILDYLIQAEARDKDTGSAQGRREVIERLRPIIRQISDSYEQQAFSEKLASVLNMDIRRLESVISQFLPSQSRQPTRVDQARPGLSEEPTEGINSSLLQEDRGELIEESLLGHVLQYEEAFERWEALELQGLPAECFLDPVNRDLWTKLTSGSAIEQADTLLGNQAEELREKLPNTLGRRALDNALRQLNHRLLRRHLNRSITEASIAIESLTQDEDAGSGELRERIDEMRRQSIVELEQLRAVQHGAWNKNTRNV